jgi:hypothetical protein
MNNTKTETLNMLNDIANYAMDANPRQGREANEMDASISEYLHARILAIVEEFSVPTLIPIPRPR